MNKRILIVKNIKHEGSGLLKKALSDHDIASTYVDLSSGELIPDPRNFNALVVLGGPQSANDESPSMLHQLKQIEKTLLEEIPYLGICLGMQTLVKAGGGKVVQCIEKESGFFDSGGNAYRVELTSSGKEDPLFNGMDDSFPVFQLHGETVELAPIGMELLATGNVCKNQAVKVGSRAYGLQCHFEMTDTMFTQWICIDADLKRLNPVTLSKQFESIRKEYTETGLRLMNNFLSISGLA